MVEESKVNVTTAGVSELAAKVDAGGKVDREPVKIELERYRNVIAYLAYENAAFWTRSAAMLVVNVALLGGVFGLMSRPPEKPASGYWALLLLAPALGLIVSTLWFLTLFGARWWIRRWLAVLVELEPLAYGEQKVMRGAFEKGGVRGPEQPPFQTYWTGFTAAVLCFVTWVVVGYYLFETMNGR